MRYGLQPTVAEQLRCLGKRDMWGQERERGPGFARNVIFEGRMSRGMTALPNYTPLIFGMLGAAMFQPAAMQAAGTKAPSWLMSHCLELGSHGKMIYGN